MRHEIITAAYHRNGVGGAGFYVAIVRTDGLDDHSGEQFLCIDFTGDRNDSDSAGYDPGMFAVLNLGMLCNGNIGMSPIRNPDTGVVIEGTGGNAWRGADRWGHDLHVPIRDWVRRSGEQAMNPFMVRKRDDESGSDEAQT